MGFLPFFNLLCFGTTDAAERRKQQSRNNNKLEHLINVNPLLDYFTYFFYIFFSFAKRSKGERD